MPDAVVKPLFSSTDLGADELLKKSLHGLTQNANESLKNFIWTRCLKREYIGKNVLELGVSSAVLNYNDGNEGVLPVFTNVFLKPGDFTVEGIRNQEKPPERKGL